MNGAIDRKELSVFQRAHCSLKLVGRDRGCSDGLCTRSRYEAPKARNMKARASAKRSGTRRPWLVDRIFEQSTESAKCQRQFFRSFRAPRSLRAFTRGDAPHVVRRLPLAFIFRAFGAQFRVLVQSSSDARTLGRTLHKSQFIVERCGFAA